MGLPGRSRVNVNEGVSRWWGYLILWAFSVCLCYVSQTTVVYLLCIQAQAENRRNEIYHTSGQTLLSGHPLTYSTGDSSQQTQTLAVLNRTYAPLYNNSLAHTTVIHNGHFLQKIAGISFERACRDKSLIK